MSGLRASLRRLWRWFYGGERQQEREQERQAARAEAERLRRSVMSRFDALEARVLTRWDEPNREDGC